MSTGQGLGNELPAAFRRAARLTINELVDRGLLTFPKLEIAQPVIIDISSQRSLSRLERINASVHKEVSKLKKERHKLIAAAKALPSRRNELAPRIRTITLAIQSLTDYPESQSKVPDVLPNLQSAS